jgi:hypothetical protein
MLARLTGAALAVLCLTPAQARQSPYPASEFNGDRWLRVAQGASATDVTRSVAKARRAHPRARRGRHRPRHYPAPGEIKPIGVLRGIKREAIEAMPTRWLVGITPTLAVKAREIVGACGSKVISGVRHTRIAGTGGRLSLHASGRAVDIKGNPACIYSHLHGWPGGYSVDYGRVQHVHISYAPHGPEWGMRFNHYRGGRRHKHRRRA